MVLLPAGTPRFATHRPAVIITTSRTALLKLRPVGPGFAQAAESPPPPPAPPASASIASHRSLTSFVHYLDLFVLGLHALVCVSV